MYYISESILFLISSCISKAFVTVQNRLLKQNPIPRPDARNAVCHRELRHRENCHSKQYDENVQVKVSSAD